jgi:hypothetical protein
LNKCQRENESFIGGAKKLAILMNSNVSEKVGRRGDFEDEIFADGILDFGPFKFPAASFKD